MAGGYGLVGTWRGRKGWKMEKVKDRRKRNRRQRGDGMERREGKRREATQGKREGGREGGRTYHHVLLHLHPLQDLLHGVAPLQSFSQFFVRPVSPFPHFLELRDRGHALDGGGSLREGGREGGRKGGRERGREGERVFEPLA